MEKEFKIGDEVAIDFGRYGKTKWLITKVIGITKTGRISVEYENLQFDKYGYKRIDNWTSIRLVEVTDKIRESIKRRKLVSEIKRVNFEEAPIGFLEKVYDLIQEEKQADWELGEQESIYQKDVAGSLSN